MARNAIFWADPSACFLLWRYNSRKKSKLHGRKQCQVSILAIDFFSIQKAKFGSKFLKTCQLAYVKCKALFALQRRLAHFHSPSYA